MVSKYDASKFPREPKNSVTDYALKNPGILICYSFYVSGKGRRLFFWRGSGITRLLQSSEVMLQPPKPGLTTAASWTEEGTGQRTDGRTTEIYYVEEEIRKKNCFV